MNLIPCVSNPVTLVVVDWSNPPNWDRFLAENDEAVQSGRIFPDGMGQGIG